jgi:hypothetical protein
VKTKREKVEIGDRVFLTGRHPWVGHSGEVIDKAMSGIITVRLDNGIESQAWPTQFQVAWR